MWSKSRPCSHRSRRRFDGMTRRCGSPRPSPPSDTAGARPQWPVFSCSLTRRRPDAGSRATPPYSGGPTQPLGGRFGAGCADRPAPFPACCSCRRSPRTMLGEIRSPAIESGEPTGTRKRVEACQRSRRAMGDWILADDPRIAASRTIDDPISRPRGGYQRPGRSLIEPPGAGCQ